MPLFLPISTAPSGTGHAPERSVLLSQQLGCELYLKCDHLQHTGSFKFRGASNKLRLLDSEQRRRGVIAASTGNHGQRSLAQLMGVGVTVYAPETAASIKLDTIRALGGTVELVPGDALNAELAGEQAAREQGKTYISPYNDEQVIAGQAPAAWSWLNSSPVWTPCSWRWVAVVISPVSAPFCGNCRRTRSLSPAGLKTPPACTARWKRAISSRWKSKKRCPTAPPAASNRAP